MKHIVTYTETYTRTYEVDECNSKEEAEEKLREDIQEGRVNGPEECCDLHMTTEIALNCPICGEEIVTCYGSARCNCGWSATDVELNEIIEDLLGDEG